jgi:hypothetical protein
MNLIARLILFPRVERKWILFDRYVFVDNEKYGFMKAQSSLMDYDKIDDYGNVRVGRSHAIWPSFHYETSLNYILSEDKKHFRRQTNFCDFEISPDCFKIAEISNGQKCKFTSVEIVQNLFICPSSGVVWQNPPDFQTNILDLKLGPRPWVFKSIPEKNFIINSSLKDSRFLENVECNLSNTAFLSGDSIKIWQQFTWQQLDDPRSFIYETNKVCKEDVIKSAARYIKKATRIAPLSESTKRFFKTLGALAHLKKAEQYATQP